MTPAYMLQAQKSLSAAIRSEDQVETYLVWAAKAESIGELFVAKTWLNAALNSHRNSNNLVDVAAMSELSGEELLAKLGEMPNESPVKQYIMATDGRTMGW